MRNFNEILWTLQNMALRAIDPKDGLDVQSLTVQTAHQLANDIALMVSVDMSETLEEKEALQAKIAEILRG